MTSLDPLYTTKTSGKLTYRYLSKPRFSRIKFSRQGERSASPLEFCKGHLQTPGHATLSCVVLPVGICSLLQLSVLGH